MVGEGTLANERGEMRPFLGLKRGGALSGDKAPKGGALGQSATEVEGGMGSCERRPVATTLWKKKLRMGGAQGRTVSQQQWGSQAAYPQQSSGP